MKYIQRILSLLFLSSGFLSLNAQKVALTVQEQCGTMYRLTAKFARNPQLKTRFLNQLKTFNNRLSAKAPRPQTTQGILNTDSNTVYTIPVVFHIVLNDPSIVTDSQLYTQLDILNKTFAGINGDTTNIPFYFKNIFGKSGIRFCLAQRTPDNENTTGIDRLVTTKTSFSHTDEGVKHASLGGVNLWDGDKYFNVWICALGNSLLGYSSFPDDGVSDEQGVVIDYRSLPGGSLSNYNEGKTLTHETGHYFNLFHIWGDDNGACTGTDYVDDTPNQANSTTGCYTGIKTDNCTTGGNGILFQDYMDYSYDPCLLLFTAQQVERMQEALLFYRPTLITSNSCVPVINKTLDAKMISINSPAQRICANSFRPVVTIGNRGSQTLDSLLIVASIDNGSAVSYSWHGSLPSLATDTISLSTVNINEGLHSIKIYTSLPNGKMDENNLNDTLTTTVQYFDAVAAVNEGFEGNIFPPQGWDIINPDGSVTWKKVYGISKSGSSSVVIDNFDYSSVGQQDFLRLPLLNLANIDSAYLSFQLAASTYTATSTVGNNWDTLEVLLSKDCGATYTSLYKKWGAKLVTSATESTRSFSPGVTDWRKDSVNLTGFINSGPLLLAFRNTTAYENNIYLDDINLKTQTINPNLKSTGFLVTPNPANDHISVQFYPNPATLTGIQLYNMLGQKLIEKAIPAGQGAGVYDFNISNYAAGTYIVRAIFTDRVLTRKVIKN